MDNLIIAQPGHKQEPEAALKRRGSFAAYDNWGFSWGTYCPCFSNSKIQPLPGESKFSRKITNEDFGLGFEL